MRADVDAARPWLDRAERHWRAAGSLVGLGWTLIILGIVRRYQGDFDRSVEAHRQASEIFVELGIERLKAFNLTTQVISLDRAGRASEALGPLREAMAIYRSLGESPIEPAAIASMVYRHLGDLSTALAILSEAREGISDASLSELPILAEEIADLAVEVGLFDAAAQLVGYATAERHRVDRPIPPPDLPERNRTDEVIRRNVDGETIALRWAERPSDHVIALMEETLEGIGRTLDASRAGSDADVERRFQDREL